MTIALTWAFFSTCVSVVLIYIFSTLFHVEASRYNRKFSGKCIWAGMSLLLIFLTACSGLTSSNENATPTITPLVLTVNSQPTATPNTPTTSSADWTTYHANNRRTGYIPGTPDPHSLSKIWSAQLDGSVYAEPLVVNNLVIVATEGDSLYALDPNRVIRAGTVSKILGAGFRLGWLCAAPAMMPVFQSFLFGGGVNPFASRVATYYLRDHMAEHVALLIDVYRAKRDAMLQGLWDVLGGTDVEVSKPEGGFFIWIKLPTGTDPARLAELAATARVQYTPGTSFYVNGGGQQFIRLAYSFEPPERCHEGARILAKAILDSRR